MKSSGPLLGYEMGTVPVHKNPRVLYEPLRDKESSGTMVSLKPYRAWPLRKFIANLKIIGETWVNIQPTLSRTCIVEIDIKILSSKHMVFFNTLQIYVNRVHSKWARELNVFVSKRLKFLNKLEIRSG